jgi:Zn finger protein HypA/HybF involved in hydrogenase expression
MDLVIIPERIGKKLNCKRCNHQWIYTGKNEFTCSCPHCKTTISIKNKMSLHASVRVGGSVACNDEGQSTNGAASYG